MKAAFVKKYKKVKIIDIPLERPDSNEVLVKIDACAVCGSDFIEAKVWAADWKRFGHEIAATVVEVGAGVPGLSAGDQVVIALSIPCKKCRACVGHNPRKCSHLIIAEQGGFAEYLLVKDYRLLVKVDPVLPVNLACLAEPLSVILDAFHLSSLQAGNHLLVVGGGNIGCMAILTAKALGIDVLGILGRNTNSGLTACLNQTSGNFFSWRSLAGLIISAPVALKKRLSELTGRLVVLHSAPPRYIYKYMDSLPFDSTVVNIGLSASKRENRVKLDFSKMIFNRLQIMSAFPVPCMHISQAVTLLHEHDALFSLLSSEQLPLEQLPEVITRRKGYPKKIIIRMKQ